MLEKRKKLLVLILVVISVLWVLNFVASKLFLVDIAWLLKNKGPRCGSVNGFLNPSVDCPSGYYCDLSHSLIDGPGYCLKE